MLFHRRKLARILPDASPQAKCAPRLNGRRYRDATHGNEFGRLFIEDVESLEGAASALPLLFWSASRC
jgi:hypothetical protein